MSKIEHALLAFKSGAEVGKEFELPEGELIIGRTGPADLVINHPQMSRRHARITLKNGGYWLEDLGSSNGTQVNGQTLTRPVSLREGDEISLGFAVQLVFHAQQVIEPTQPQMGMPVQPLRGPAPHLVEQVTPDQLLMPQQPEDQTPAPKEPKEQEAIKKPLQMPHEEQPPVKIPSLKQPEKPAAASVQKAEAAGLAPRLLISFIGPGSGTELSVELIKDQINLGRADDNDIVVPSIVVSRHHARLERCAGGYQVIPIPGVANPLMLGDKPLTQPYRLENGDTLQVGSPSVGISVLIKYSQAVDESATRVEVAPRPAAQSLDASETLLAEEPPENEQPGMVSAQPPRLVVTLAGQPPQTYTLTKPHITIGRADDCDILVPSMIISRHHATLEQTVKGYEVVINPGATNTLTCQGRAVVDRQLLRNGDVLRIDSDIPGLMVSMAFQAPAQPARSQTIDIQFVDKEKLTFGRDQSNDVVLNMPNVSRFHSQVTRVGRRFFVTDLHSANGTFVNDQRVEKDTWLQPQDTIRIGPYRFVLGENAFTRYDGSEGVRVEAVGLNKWVRKNLNLLQDISLVFQPREFIVVVGQSGGGKSTLVDSIAGFRPATHGKVYVNNTDIYRDFDAIRNEIGYVPQKDIIHMELTVYQVLDYAAQLRMPKDTSESERHKRIMEVLEELDLVHRKDVTVNGLSGGQQKRVSIGVELLTRPGLFFLDEPTSGLDPGTETAFMHLMRRLADQGRTIVMVTHATKNVILADKVVFLARGGYLAWFGPPDEALAYFDQYRSERDRRIRPMEFDQIYSILDDQSKGKATDWAQRFQASEAYKKYVVEPLKSRQAEEAAAKAVPQKSKASRRRGKISSFAQFAILSARNIKILTRDRTSLILMLLAAPLIGSLDLVLAPLMGRAPFDISNGNPANAAVSLFMVTVYSLMVGGMSQMREFVKETNIYRRERLVNLRILPYILSKMWVALLLAFYQALAYTILHHLAFQMPYGLLEFGMFYVTLVLATFAGMMSGLFASAISPNASASPLIMILLIVPQIVLSGALAPVPSTINSVTSSRWAFQTLIGITGMGSDVAADVCWKLDEKLQLSMTVDDKLYQGCRCMGPKVFDKNSCAFPGVGAFYTQEIDQQPPVEPPGMPAQPAEPVIPAAPRPPDDKYDQVKMVQYLNALDNFQGIVKDIQDDYRNQMDLYQAQGEVYKGQMMAYQEALARYNIARVAATQSAEGLIRTINEKYGWAWVSKLDPPAFYSWIFTAWSAQGIIAAVYFVLIVISIKMKDV